MSQISPGRKAKTNKAPASDLGATLLSKHHQVKVDISPNWTARARIIDSCPIDRLFYDGLLNNDQHEAMQQFRRDYELMHIGVGAKAKYTMAVQAPSQDISNKAAEALFRMNQAMKYVAYHMPGAERCLWNIVVDEIDPGRKKKVTNMVGDLAQQLLDFYNKYYHIKTVEGPEAIAAKLFN